MVNYEVTGMSTKDLYRRVKNGQIILESKHLDKITTGSTELLLRGVLYGTPFPTIVLLRAAGVYRVILGGKLLGVLESSVYEGLDDVDKFILMRYCFCVNIVTDICSIGVIKAAFERFG